MKDKKLYTSLRPAAHGLMKLLYRPTITIDEEIPHEEKIILAGNHIHLLDAVLVSMATDRQIYFLAKKDVFKGPMKAIFKGFGCIPVDRDGKDFATLKESIDILNQDGCIGIFPEGTRNRTDDIILPFKLGTVVLAMRSKSDIIPFAITGDYKLFGSNLHLHVGKRINTKDYGAQELLNETEDRVKKLILKG